MTPPADPSSGEPAGASSGAPGGASNGVPAGPRDHASGGPRQQATASSVADDHPADPPGRGAGVRDVAAVAVSSMRAWTRAPLRHSEPTAAQRAITPPRPRTPRFRPTFGVGTLGLYPIHVGFSGLVAGLIAGPRAPVVVAALVAAGVLAVGALLHRATPATFPVPLPPPPEPEERGVRTLPRPGAIPVRATRVAAVLAAATVAVVLGATVAVERLRALDRTELHPRADVQIAGFVTEPPRTRAYGVTVVPVRITSIGALRGAASGESGRTRDGAATGAVDTDRGMADASGGGATAGGVGETVLVRAPARVRVPAVRVGDEVVAGGDLRWLRARESFERRRGVHAVVEADRVEATGGTRTSPIDAIRRRIEDALDRGLPPEQAALARGMVLGQDAALPNDLREAFRASGLAHLVAASGQNVMLLASLVLMALTVVGAPLRLRLAAALAAILLYVPLAGAGASIQRAGTMGAAGLVAALASRPASRWHALLLAAAATLALNPRAVEDPGWQLSFAAVIAILALHRPLRDALVRRPADPWAAALDAVVAAEEARLATLAPSDGVPGGPPADAEHAAPADRAAVAFGEDALAAIGRAAEAEPGTGADRAGGGLGGRADAEARWSGARRVRRWLGRPVGRSGAGRMRGWLPGPLADAAALTIAATLGTAPLLSLHFGAVSLVSLPANLLAVPAVAPVMWLGTLAGLAGGAVGVALDAIAALPLAYLSWLGRTAAAVPYASVGAQLPGAMAAAATYTVLGALCVAARHSSTRRRVRATLVALGLIERDGGPRWRVLTPAGVLVAAVLAFVVAAAQPRPPDGPTLTLLDVGQGEATLLQDGGRAMLVDTGPPGAPLVRELRAAGVRRLDVVLISHSASDHEGGLPALLRAMPVGLVLDGRGAGRANGGEGGGARYEGLPADQPRRVPAAGQRLRIGGVVVDILWPPPGDPRRGDPNDTAAVALARCGPTTALLTADAESPVTLPLDLPQVDVLKVAHHGSVDPGLPVLLARLRPRTALIPVGPNTYGHPAPSTLRALRAAVPEVRRTDRDGTIRVPLGRSCSRPEGHRPAQ